jgi:hypothetical protein
LPPLRLPSGVYRVKGPFAQKDWARRIFCHKGETIFRKSGKTLRRIRTRKLSVMVWPLEQFNHPADSLIAGKATA